MRSWAREKFFHVLSDDRCNAELALEHFRSRGFQHFAFCSFPTHWHYNLDQRGELFRHAVAKAGFVCQDYRFPQMTSDWDQTEEDLASWLRRLPKPVGIFACHDEHGFKILEACHRARLQVPEEVAVLGVDNDPILCNMSNPPMSSIDADGERIGYEAAALLDRLMRGQKPRSRLTLIEPRGLVARRSTDVYAFADAELTAALRFIGQHACEGAKVRDVLKAVALSQNELEQRFRRYLGRSPKAELLRVQIERAQQLLRDTDLPLKSIAARSGFHTEQYFSDAFFRRCGLRPGAYRQRHRYKDDTGG